MLEPQQVEELICIASAMSREAIIERMLNFNGAFPVDFTQDFLERMPIERLRHIFVALCLQHQHLPAEAA